jgi:hypothetical protein
VHNLNKRMSEYETDNNSLRQNLEFTKKSLEDEI